jgi:hypothetical protein
MDQHQDKDKDKNPHHRSRTPDRAGGAGARANVASPSSSDEERGESSSHSCIRGLPSFSESTRTRTSLQPTEADLETVWQEFEPLSPDYMADEAPNKTLPPAEQQILTLLQGLKVGLTSLVWQTRLGYPARSARSESGSRSPPVQPEVWRSVIREEIVPIQQGLHSCVLSVNQVLAKLETPLDQHQEPRTEVRDITTQAQVLGVVKPEYGATPANTPTGFMPVRRRHGLDSVNTPYCLPNDVKETCVKTQDADAYASVTGTPQPMGSLPMSGVVDVCSRDHSCDSLPALEAASDDPSVSRDPEPVPQGRVNASSESAVTRFLSPSLGGFSLTDMMVRLAAQSCGSPKTKSGVEQPQYSPVEMDTTSSSPGKPDVATEPLKDEAKIPSELEEGEIREPPSTHPLHSIRAGPPLIILPVLCGAEGEDVEAWVTQVQQDLQQRQRLSDTDRYNAVVASLKGYAAEYYLQTARTLCNDWTTLVEALRRRFSIRHAAIVRRAADSVRIRQGRTESINAYRRRLDAARDKESRWFKESEKIELFWDGLRSTYWIYLQNLPATRLIDLSYNEFVELVQLEEDRRYYAKLQHESDHRLTQTQSLPRPTPYGPARCSDSDRSDGERQRGGYAPSRRRQELAQRGRVPDYVIPARREGYVREHRCPTLCAHCRLPGHQYEECLERLNGYPPSRLVYAPPRTYPQHQHPGNAWTAQ